MKVIAIAMVTLNVSVMITFIIIAGFYAPPSIGSPDQFFNMKDLIDAGENWDPDMSPSFTPLTAKIVYDSSGVSALVYQVTELYS